MIFKQEIKLSSALILLINPCLVVSSILPVKKCIFEYYFESQQDQHVDTFVSPYKCYCGPNQVTLTYLSDQYCCVPPEDECTFDSRHTFCPSGKLMNKYEPCNGGCHNEHVLRKKDLNTKEIFKTLDAYYSCDDVCLPASEMCQGISCGNQTQMCKEVFGCVEYYGRTERGLNETKVISEHHYCKYS